MKDTLLQDIVAAMESHELQAFYQPQYNAKKGVIGGAEALVRWVKNDGTIVPPSKFIPDLEERGQVDIVDWFVAEETCRTIKALGANAVCISVNFGREHANDPMFVYKLDALIETYGIEKKYLGIEITESNIAADKNQVIQWVNDIERAGYLVLIDDFGSGMSSLSFVKDIPAKVLKIDRSFLNDNCLKRIVDITVPESKDAVENAFNRRNLLEAHKRGDKCVLRIVKQLDDIGDIHNVAIEDYFIENPASKDVFIVSFIQVLDFIEDVIV